MSESQPEDDFFSNPFNGSPIYRGLEKLFERQLESSSAARAAARKLDGKALALEITGVNLNIYVKCSADKIELSSEFDQESDVIISGSPLAMLAFARSQDQDAFRGGGIKFTGDIGVAQEFQKLFGLLSPDFEEELSRLIGDEAAHQVGSAARDLFGWGRKAASSFSQGLGQYLSSNSGGNASQTDLEEFFDDVDRIRADVERAEVNFERVIRQFKKG